nr:Tn3 family transposase [Nocardia rhamnosiphila]
MGSAPIRAGSPRSRPRRAPSNTAARAGPVASRGACGDATDTHGVTLVNFGLFDLLGMQLSPRIRDLGRITLYRPEPRADAEARFPRTGPLMTRKLNTELIAEHWDDLLRIRLVSPTYAEVRTYCVRKESLAELPRPGRAASEPRP